jgi:hypothetical protein
MSLNSTAWQKCNADNHNHGLLVLLVVQKPLCASGVQHVRMHAREQKRARPQPPHKYVRMCSSVRPSPVMHLRCTSRMMRSSKMRPQLKGKQQQVVHLPGVVAADAALCQDWDSKLGDLPRPRAGVSLFLTARKGS